MTSLHFTPPRNWMNDPNGLLFRDGRFHLFFQYNPLGVDHAQLSWGHASSTDLVHWDDHPVAIRFDDDEEIFSGSIVVDEARTTGLGTDGAPPLIAFYTSMWKRTGRQSQSIAYSVDGGTTWTKYADNPVLDRDSANFRDPKVIRWQGDGESHWVMVAVEAVDRQVVLYRSDDLLTWEFLSTFGPVGAVGGDWECPDLFPLRVDGTGDVHWVLLVSLNPGGIAGGSGTQYFVGDFDGRSFTLLDETGPDETGPDESGPGESAPTGWLDYGRDCYAGVSFAGLPDGDRTLIGWMSNWDYARTMPVDPAAPSRGAMTMARRVSLAGIDGEIRLRQRAVGPPVTVGTQIEGRTVTARDELAVPLPDAGRVDLAIALGDAAGFTAEFRGGDGRYVVLAYDAPSGELTLDRRPSSDGFPAEFASVEHMPVAAVPVIGLSIWFDEHAVEIYAEDGTRVLTDLTGALRPTSLHIAGRGGDVQIAELTVAAASTGRRLIGDEK